MPTMLRAVLAIAFLCQLAACGPRSARGSTSEPVGPPARPRVLAFEPGCPYRVVGTITVQSPTSSIPASAITRQARALGAYAVLRVSHSREYENGRPAGSEWTGHAIVFSDPSDPDCYD